MRRTRHIVLPVKSWQYMGLMIVSLACLTLGLVSRDRGGRSESLAGPELQHTAPHGVDACPNLHPFHWMSRYDETAFQKGPNDYSGDTRALVSVNTVKKSIAKELPENLRSTLDKENSAIRNRRSIAIDRRIRTIDTSRLRRDNDDRLSSKPSRNRDIRRKPSSLHEKRTGVNPYRSDKSDHRTRQSYRRLEPVSVRSSDSRSRELREEPNSMVLRRNINEPSYRTSYNDQANRKAIDIRSARSRAQRLNSEPHDYRSNERSDDRVTRSLSNDRRSFERRFSDFDRTDRSNSVLRRVVRSVSRRDKRDDQSSRISRSWNNRMEQRTEDRRSSRTHRQSDFISKRTDANRSATRQINQHESRERIITDRSSKPNSGVARTRSADSYRVNDGRVEIPSQNRRLVEQLEKDSRRQENGRIAVVELYKKAARDSSRSRVSRQSSNRNIDRSDIGGTRVRSVAQDSFERRITNPIQYRTMRVDLLARSGDAKRSRLPVIGRAEVRRVEVRSGERRIVAQSDFALAQRRVRSIHDSERRLYQERQARLADRSKTRRILQENEPDRLERRKKPLSARSEERRSSGTEVREPMTRLDSLRRVAMSMGSSQARGVPVRGERSATRFVSGDRQTSTVHLKHRRASSFDSSRLSLGSTSNVMDSQRRERFALSDGSRATHPGQAKQIVSRNLRTSNSGHRKSALVQARRVSGMDSVERRSMRNSRNSRTRDIESFQPVAIRDATDQRRALSTERAVTRRLGNSQERRAASTMKVLGQTSGTISLYQNGRTSAESRMTRERGDLSNQRPVAREIQMSNGRRERFAAAITRDLGKSRAQDGVGAYRKDRNTIDNEIRFARKENNRRIFEKRSLMKSLTSVPDLAANIEKISEAKTNEYAHQILLLVICAIYGASLLKGKAGFCSFRNIVAPSSRLVVW